VLLAVIGMAVLGYAAAAILTTAFGLNLHDWWPAKNAGGARADNSCRPYSPSFGKQVPPRWMKPPQKIRHVAPVYPRAAKDAGVQGPVLVEATIGCSGKVTGARVLRSVSLLDEPALQAVRQWEYQPVVDDKGARREVVIVRNVFFSAALNGP
jgi:TonB family protein